MYRTLELVKPFTCISFDPPSDDAVRVCVIIPFHRCGNWGSPWSRDLLKITHWVYGKASPQTGAVNAKTLLFLSFFFLLPPWFLNHWHRMKPEYQNALWSLTEQIDACVSSRPRRTQDTFLSFPFWLRLLSLQNQHSGKPHEASKEGLWKLLSNYHFN